jgi:PAS domain S-box-containing protein
VHAKVAWQQRLAHSGSWAFSAPGFDHWSSELFRIHGLETGGKPPTTEEYLALVHPEDRDAVACQIRNIVEKPTEFDFTTRIVRPRGAVRHVRCVGRHAPTSGALPWFIGTMIDVTEHEQLTSALRRREDALRQVVDLTPQVVAVYGPRCERVYANRWALAYFGMTLDDWLRLPDGFEVHPDDPARLKTPMEDAFTNGTAFELETRLRAADGSYRWFLARGNPVRDDRGVVTNWYVASTDIDERKKAEDRLRQENVALREEVDKASMFEDIVGESPALAAVLSRVAKVAGSDSTVLITGETGTGKLRAHGEAIDGAFHASKDGPPTARFIWGKLEHFLDHLERGGRRAAPKSARRDVAPKRTGGGGFRGASHGRRSRRPSASVFARGPCEDAGRIRGARSEHRSTVPRLSRVTGRQVSRSRKEDRVMFRDGRQTPVAATRTCESFTGKCSRSTCRATTSRNPYGSDGGLLFRLRRRTTGRMAS